MYEEDVSKDETSEVEEKTAEPEKVFISFNAGSIILSCWHGSDNSSLLPTLLVLMALKITFFCVCVKMRCT